MSKHCSTVERRVLKHLSPKGARTIMKTYKIDGMTCGGCVASITRAFKAENDALEIEVDLQAGTLRVGEMKDADVQRIVEDAGFDYAGPLG